MRRRSKIGAQAKPRKKLADPKKFLFRGEGGSVVNYEARSVVFTQGDAATAIFYIQTGKVKLTVVSKAGKEVTMATMKAGDFFGEGCLGGQSQRAATAMTISECSILRLERDTAVQALLKDPAFSARLLSYMLVRKIRIEEDLVEQLFNSIEKRLARMLLLRANFGSDGRPKKLIPKISHERLAEMIGTTRFRVEFFLNRFRKRGFIDINGGIEIHQSLLTVVLSD